MAELTKDQKKALALANARARLEQDSTGVDVAKSAGSGLAGGALDLVGLPGTIGDVLQSGMGHALSKGFEAVTGREPQLSAGGVEGFFAPQQMPASPFSGESLRAGADQLTGGAISRQPETVPGEFAKTIGQFVPGAAAFGGVSNIGRFGVLPGAASEAAGQVTKGTGVEPYARLGAALAAPAATSMVGRAITPNPISSDRAAMVAALKRENIPITAGQVTGRRGLQYLESGLAGGGKAAGQGEAFTSAVLRRANIKGKATTPEVMRDAYKTLGDRFDDLERSNTLIANNQFADDILQVVDDYTQRVGTPAKVVENKVTAVMERVKNGAITGDKFQSAASDLRRTIRGTRDPDVKGALTELKGVIDDAMEASIAANNPGDLGKWQAARRDYKNFLVVERAAAAGGEVAASGQVTPAQLRMATQNISGKRYYTQGLTDFDDLARAGQSVMFPLPQSGTAPRLATGAGAAGLAAIGGGVDPSVVAKALIAGAVAPHVAGKALMSRPVQGYLANQAVTPSHATDPRTLAMLAALLGRNQQTLPGAQ